MKGRLYISHFLTSWTDRVFEFSCFLLIGDIFNTSLLLASIYGFITTISAIIWSNWVGSLCDHTSRLRFVRMTMITQKTSIVAACVLFYAILEYNYRPVLLYSGILFCGCTLKLAFIANNIAIEKDWVLIISEGNTEAMLTVMKRIDLFCKTMAPVMIGALMSFGPSIGVIVIAVWNTLSLIVEYQLVFQTYRAYPALASKSTDFVNNREADEHTSLLNGNNGDDYSTHNNEGESNDITFMDYVRHKIFLPSLAIAMLYLTVLSFGGIMVSYLKMIGYSDWSLGILRAVAGISGIGATYILPYLSAKIGIIRSGLWALWFESITLAPVVVSLTSVTSGTVWGPIMLFGGMSLSRIGLWIYDISETILLQQIVEPNHIGSISGWQHSLCNFFDLSQYILTAIISDPKDFVIPASVSLGAVVCASIAYTVFVRRERGHLFHFKQLM
ncbi:MAG: Ferroporti-1 [Benjaminiella poitrasii]|nr:MAG: Ferroporti-1 [Benjaminiella poitrasii]